MIETDPIGTNGTARARPGRGGGGRRMVSRGRRITLRALPRRALVGFGALSLVSIVMLALAPLLTGYPSDLLLNIGSSLVMVAFGYVIFDPLFEEARRARVEEHARFDHESFCDRVSGSRRTVAILETWTGLLEDTHRARFLRALEAALHAEVEVRVLLLDPDSDAAAQRTEELAHVNVSDLIRQNLRHLHRFRTGDDLPRRGRLAVRVYDASPSIQLYQWDDKALISFFPLGVRAYDAPQIEAYVASPWGDFVRGRFDELWGHPSTRDLDQYMCLTVTVRRDDEDLARCRAHYVVWNGTDYYLDGAAMVDQLADHGVGRLNVRSDWALGAHGVQGDRFTMVRVADDDDPSRHALSDLFDSKYGADTADRDRRRTVLRLVPAG